MADETPATSNEKSTNGQAAAAVKKGGFPLWGKIAIGCGALALLVIAALVALFMFIWNKGADSEKVLEEFMRKAAANDVVGAYELTSKDFREATTQERLAAVFSQRQFFEGFTDLEQTSLNVSKTNGQTVYRYEGNVHYSGKPDRKMTANTTEEDGEQKVRGFDVK